MKVLTCAQFNAETQVCEVQVWADPMPLGLPPLTPEEGAAMGAAVFGLFFVAWLLKRLRSILSTM